MCEYFIFDATMGEIIVRSVCVTEPALFHLPVTPVTPHGRKHSLLDAEEMFIDRPMDP